MLGKHYGVFGIASVRSHDVQLEQWLVDCDYDIEFELYVLYL